MEWSVWYGPGRPLRRKSGARLYDLMVPRLALGPILLRTGRLTRDPPRCVALAGGKNVTTFID
jgi:hypothetical protein